MGRISNSIQLAKASWQVLTSDKELLVLPVISGIASIIAAATFIVPLLATTDLEQGTMSPIGYVVLFLMYVVLAYITIFFNAALISAAHERLGGGDPTVRSALQGASFRAGKILPWAIVSATVSIILRAIEERAGFVGQLVAGLAGLAWTVVTFLVLPIIVIEGDSVGDAIKRSGQMFKQTWGENLAAQVGFGIIGFLAILPVIPIVILGFAAGSAAAIVAIAVAVLWVIGVSVVMAALSVVFQTVLYHFAIRKQVPTEAFSASMLQGAFQPKRGTGSNWLGR